MVMASLNPVKNERCVRSTDDHHNKASLARGICSGDMGRMVSVSNRKLQGGPDDRAVERYTATSIIVRDRDIGGKEISNEPEIRRADVRDGFAVNVAAVSTTKSEPRNNRKRTQRVAPGHHDVGKEMIYVLSSSRTDPTISKLSSVGSASDNSTDETLHTFKSDSVHAHEPSYAPTTATTTLDNTSICEQSSVKLLSIDDPQKQTKKGRKDDRGDQKLRVWKARKTAAAELEKDFVIEASPVITVPIDDEKLEKEHDGGAFVGAEGRGAARRLGAACNERASGKPRDVCRGESRSIKIKEEERRKDSTQTHRAALPRGVLPYPFKAAAISKAENANRVSSREATHTAGSQARKAYPPGILPYPFPTKATTANQIPANGRKAWKKRSKRLDAYQGEYYPISSLPNVPPQIIV